MSHTKEPVHLAKLLFPYKGKWVALSHDETKIVGVGVTLDEALEGAKKKGEESLSLSNPRTNIPPFFCDPP